MSSRRRRDHTPGPISRRGGGTGDDTREEAKESCSESETAKSGGDASPAAAAAAHPSSPSSLVAARHCTDVFCLLVLVACSAALAWSAWGNYKSGDLRVLRNGFDFRGELCGGTSDSRSQGRFLHWCNARVSSGKEEHRWDRPICVDVCPKGGETIHCPDGGVETVRSEEHERGGGVVLVHVARQRLIPMTADPTHRLNSFCLPKDLGHGALVNLMTHTKRESWSGLALHVVMLLENVLERPLLLLVLVVLAIFSARAWVYLLHTFSQTLAHAGFVVTAFALLATGALAVLAPRAKDVVQQVVPASAGNATAIGDAVGAAAGGMMDSVKGAVSQSLLSAASSGFLADAVGWLDALDGGAMPMVRVGIGAFFVAAGVAVLLWYCYARSSIAIAADCMRGACDILSTQPSLMFLLPLLNWAMFLLVTLGSFGGCALLLSTAEAHAVTYTINGEKVAGVFRNFTWTGHLVGGVLAWFFALLWYQELITAIRAYVLSQTAVQWYFTPEGERRGSWFALAKGILVAVFFHLGSLAFGAFILSVLRAFRWFLLLVHEFTQTDNKWIKWVLGCFDLIVTLAEQIMQRVNRFAYTDMAINSSNFCTASSGAASIMMESAALVWMRSAVLRPAKYLASLAYAGTFGWGMRLLLAMPPAKFKGILPAQLLQEWEELGSPAAAAVLAGGMSFLAVRCFTASVDDVADAVLYCCLWEKRHGRGPGEAPDACKSLVGVASMRRAKVD